METSKLDAIHKELKSMNERLSFIENLVEDVIVRDLPRVKISEKERREIISSIEEMKRGKRVTLEELRRA